MSTVNFPLKNIIVNSQLSSCWRMGESTWSASIVQHHQSIILSDNTLSLFYIIYSWISIQCVIYKACSWLLLYHERVTLLSNKGLFTLSTQLSYFSKNWGMQRDIPEFYKFHKLILTHICYSWSKVTKIPQNFVGKNVKFSDKDLETMNWGNWFLPKTWNMVQNLI